MNAASVLRIDAAIRGNKVIYWLGRIPLIRRLVSDTLYFAKEGKLALSILLWVWRIIKSFGGTILYVGAMCVAPLLIFEQPLPELFHGFCWLLFVLSFLLGALLNPCAVEKSQLKYTCIRMMNMNAGKYHLIIELKHHLEYFVTFLAALLIACPFFRQSPLTALQLTAELSCARLLFDRLHLWLYDKLGNPLYGRTGFTLLVIFTGLAAAYVPVFLVNTGADRWLLSIPALLVCLVLGALSALSLCRYPRYYRLTLDTCSADTLSAEVLQAKSSKAQFADVQLVDSDLTAEGGSSTLSGWPLLQDLFFRRHRRMMYKPLWISLIIVAILTVIAGVLLLIFRDDEVREIMSAVSKALPFCVFFLYIIQNNVIGNRITKAMFYNCDLAMLKFGWYREPQVVLKNFLLRFTRLCGVNLLLSAAVCLMFTILTLCGGGRPPMGQYLAFMAALLCLAVFFTVHSLGMYYLFQPFTSDLKVKNPFFNAINIIMYILCYSCIQIRSTPSWFTLVVLIVTVVYSAVILSLVWKRAPKTFRVK